MTNRQQLVFRFAQLRDLPEIVAIYNSTIASRMVTADTEPVSVESREAWFHQHNPEHRPLWMVEANQQLVGWVSFTSFYGRPAYQGTVEISLYLHPNHRGKGYGKAILHQCEAEARARGIHTLLGFIFAHNQPSLTLFTQAGYQEWAHLPQVAVLDNIERSLKILGKRL